MKSILVIGATGQQGGSVLRFLYENGSFHIKAMVRDLNSDKAKALIEKYPNVTLVLGDLNDVASLTNAMEGCYGVFGVTNFWDPSVGYDGEIRQGKNIGDACKNANVKHLVFSTLEGGTGVAHLESKSIAETYIRSLGVPMTALYTSAYFENVFSFFAPKEVEGKLIFSIAQKETTKVPMYSVNDTGGWAIQAFLNPVTINKKIAAVSEYLTYHDVAHIYGKAVGKEAEFQSIPLNIFRTFGFPGVNELADMFNLYDEMSEGTTIDIRKQLLQDQQLSGIDFSGQTFEQFMKNMC